MKNKILSIAGLVMFILLILVWTTPYLFKGKIIQIVRTRISKDLNARVNLGDADISWFRHFPRLTVGLVNPQIIGVGEFDGDTLIAARNVDIVFYATSFVFGDSLRVHSLHFEEPRLYALIHGNGHANWDITQAAGEINTAPAKPFKLALQRYSIHNGYVRFEDERTNRLVELQHLDQEGKGDFDAAQFPLKTKTEIEAMSFSEGSGIPIRLTAKTSIEMTLRVDQTSNTWSFNTDRVKLNELKLHTDGFFQWINDSTYDMNIRFHTPSSAFKDILSMLSPVYRKSFESIKSSGLIVFNGFIKGKYDAKQRPAYHVNLDIENGFFQYPDLPMPVQNINLAFHLDNPDGIADHSLLNIRKGHLEINNEPLDFHLLVKNPSTKPVIDLALEGKLDLANISKLMKFESGTRLSGMIHADLYAKGGLGNTDKKSKEAFQAGGKLDLNNFMYTSADYPGGIGLNQLLMSFNAKNTQLTELNGEYRSTHFDGNGTFNNLFEYLVRKNPLQGIIHLKADEINVREWMGTSADSNMSGSPHRPGSNFSVPSGIDFTVDAEAGNLHYDDLDMQHLAGKLLISDETIRFNALRGDALEGSVTIGGTYSTKEGRERPEIDMVYDVAGLDLQKTLFTFHFLQNMMPVGKFMSGKFDARMSMAGRLGDGMSPEPKTLHGTGSILLHQGSIRDFAPLNQLFQSLDISAQKEIALENIKTDFSYEGGKMTMDPFIVHAENLDMEIFGKHGFDQTLEYGINLKVDRTRLGNKGSVFVKNVVKDAADKGIPIRLADAVNVNVKMGGTINNPDIKTDMNATVDQASDDLKKEVDDFVNAKLDSAREQLRKPAIAKKQAVVKISNKSKKHSTVKSGHTVSHKQTAHANARKHSKSGKKYYSTSLKKQKSTAMITRK
jgi:hypothetical protein